MKLRLTATLAVVVASLLATEARANFDYTTVINPPAGGTATFGTSSSVVFGNVSKTNLNGSQNINIADVSILSTKLAPPTDSGSVAFTDTITITDPSGGGTTGTFTVSGTLNVTRADTGGELSSLTVSSISGPIVLNGTTYSLDGISYAPPTINSGNGTPPDGNISALLTVAVPEPASIALVSLGGLGMIALARRSRKAKAQV